MPAPGAPTGPVGIASAPGPCRTSVPYPDPWDGGRMQRSILLVIAERFAHWIESRGWLGAPAPNLDLDGGESAFQVAGRPRPSDAGGSWPGPGDRAGPRGRPLWARPARSRPSAPGRPGR